MATELSIIEKCAVDALLAAWGRFSNQIPFDGEGFAALLAQASTPMLFALTSP